MEALDRANKATDYYALDMSLPELQRSLTEVPPSTFTHVRCHGLFGTYDDGLEWLKQGKDPERPKCIVSLGSSVGIFERADAQSFLRNFAEVLKPSDVLIVGVDGCLDRDKVLTAYNDGKGVTEQFYRNGLRNANKLLGQDVFKENDWDIIGVFNADEGRHEAFISPRTDIVAGGFSFNRGERISLENAHKYSDPQQQQLWHGAGLRLDASFVERTGTYCKSLVAFYGVKPLHLWCTFLSRGSQNN